MGKSTYPATNNQEAVDLNILNANAFHMVLNGDVTTDVPTYEGNGTIPSVAKALHTMAAYKAPIPWEEGVSEADILQPRTFADNIFVPIRVPAVMDSIPSDLYWKLYFPTVGESLNDTGENYFREVLEETKSTFVVPFDIKTYLVSGVERPQVTVFVHKGNDVVEKVDVAELTYVDKNTFTLLNPATAGNIVEIYSTTIATFTIVGAIRDDVYLAKDAVHADRLVAEQASIDAQAARDAAAQASADAQDARDVAIAAKYDVGEFYFFRHPILKPGFAPLNGGLISGAYQGKDITVYPIWEYLQTADGQLLLKTEAEWQAMTTAIWHTNADGTTVGWDGIGGAPYYVQDLGAGTLRMPDVRGMYAEAAGFDSLGVGEGRGDHVRRMLGSFIGYDTNGDSPQTWAGPFYRTEPYASAPVGGSASVNAIEIPTIFDTARVVPVGPAFAPRRWGALACAYLGQPA